MRGEGEDEQDMGAFDCANDNVRRETLGGGGGKKATAIPLRHVKPSESDSETTALIDRRERSTRRFRGGGNTTAKKNTALTDERARTNEQQNDHSLVSFYDQRNCACDAVRKGEGIKTG